MCVGLLTTALIINWSRKSSEKRISDGIVGGLTPPGLPGQRANGDPILNPSFDARELAVPVLTLAQQGWYMWDLDHLSHSTRFGQNSILFQTASDIADD